MGLHVMFTKTESHREKAQTGSLGISLKRNILKKSVSQVIFRLSRNACAALRLFQGMKMMGSKMLKSCNYTIA